VSRRSAACAARARHRGSPSRATLLGLGVVALTLIACADRSSTPGGPSLAGEIDERFLSVAVDIDQLAGGTFWDPAGGPTVVDVPPYDFGRVRLRNLAAALAPAYLRLGGSASDRTFYDLSDAPVSSPPPPFELVLTRAQLDAARAFAQDLGFDVVFTVAAGAGPRNGERRWTPGNARELLEYASAQGRPLAVLEFGNEPNLFAVRAGLSDYTAADFAGDLETFLALRDEAAPDTPVLAPGNIYTRTQGEEPVAGVVFGPRATETIPLLGTLVDGLSYHYYAAVSTRCPLGPRITADTALDPAYLDGVDEPADATESLREAHAPGKPIWVTETGGQSCGGQLGVADRFVNTFWYLDTLGRLARRGHQVVVRQTLSGSTYGLIDELSLEPRPDYWAALLWRRLMGTRVLALPELGASSPLRLFAHCTRGGGVGAVTLLALNTSGTAPVELPLADLGLPLEGELYVASAPTLDSPQIEVNGNALIADVDGVPPAIAAARFAGPTLALAPATWTFAVFPDARASACLGGMK